jgi:hypothetical protein
MKWNCASSNAALGNRGSCDHCTVTKELKLSVFVGRLASPVLTDIKLRIDGSSTSDV